MLDWFGAKLVAVEGETETKPKAPFYLPAYGDIYSFDVPGTSLCVRHNYGDMALDPKLFKRTVGAPYGFKPHQIYLTLCKDKGTVWLGHFSVDESNVDDAGSNLASLVLYGTFLTIPKPYLARVVKATSGMKRPYHFCLDPTDLLSFMNKNIGYKDLDRGIQLSLYLSPNERLLVGMNETYLVKTVYSAP